MPKPTGSGVEFTQSSTILEKGKSAQEGLGHMQREADNGKLNLAMSSGNAAACSIFLPHHLLGLARSVTTYSTQDLGCWERSDILSLQSCAGVPTPGSPMHSGILPYKYQW